MSQPTPPPNDPWAIGATPASAPAPAPNQFAFGDPLPQPYAAPNWPAVPQRRRWVPWVVIAAVLVVGGVASGLIVLGLRVSHAMSDAKGAVNGFLYAVEIGDVSTAQTHVCAEAPGDAVQSTVASHIHRHHVVGVVIHNNTTLGSDPGSSHEYAQVAVDVTLTSGDVHRDVVDVELEHGTWLVCGVTREKMTTTWNGEARGAEPPSDLGHG